MADMAETYRTRHVRITNGLDVPFTDRHDGIPVIIEPGKSETLPLDMAAHFFGYHEGIEPQAMFRHVCKRQGWNTPAHVKQDPETHKTLAETYFGKLKIEPVTYRLVEEREPDLAQPIPADPQPPANAEDEEDEPATVRRSPPKRVEVNP